MFNNKGFTLIELVIVIVLLGILAALAMPYFMNLRKDSEVAIVQSLKGALQDGSRLVHAKAAIEHLDDGNENILINGGEISIRAGYPRVAGNCLNFTDQLQYWISMDIDNSICSSGNNTDWYGTVKANAFHFMPANYTSIIQNCYVTYTTASERINGAWIDTESATVTAETSGCGG
ncbi:type II secretion system protein [Psychromonas sp. RZ22]|uniref:pilus assembly FimT family protein n=1 Tax=Psychromonas algarum TaxID=2555643 RepID=UPI001068AE30|nr:prepilin-type N-terminal cleavage/methylation domain-containing protein [Psychromonas sp. RZ22]TEW55233.1 type II secretion system protein [Psychromonas sp. RZ22]